MVRSRSAGSAAFEGKNQIAGGSEPIHFGTTLMVRDGDSAGIAGLPIFLGLTVGGNGVQLNARTIFIGSDVHDALVGIFESDLHRKGLSLLRTAQPALALLALTAGNVVRFLLSGPKNKEMHVFKLGFDFAGSGTSPRLRLGSYVVVQGGDQQTIPLSDCIWDHDRSRLL